MCIDLESDSTLYVVCVCAYIADPFSPSATRPLLCAWFTSGRQVKYLRGGRHHGKDRPQINVIGSH